MIPYTVLPPFENSDEAWIWPSPTLYDPHNSIEDAWEGPIYYDRECIARDAVQQHQTLFSLVYGQQVHLDMSREQALFHIASVIAYAEYYDLLPAIATRIEALLLDIPWLEEIIGDYPEFFIAISNKLRCAPLFDDAIRHCVGKHMSYKELTFTLSTSEACTAITPAKECLSARCNTLIEKLRGVLIPERSQMWEDSKHWNPVFRSRADEENAENALREWLDCQLHSDSYLHPYMRLRGVCNAVVISYWYERCNPRFLGPRLRKKHNMKKAAIKPLIRKMEKLIEDQFGWGAREPSRCEVCGGDQEDGHQWANFQYDHHLYFTYMAVSSDKPWSKMGGYEDFEPPAPSFVDAGDEWLAAICVKRSG